MLKKEKEKEEGEEKEGEKRSRRRRITRTRRKIPSFSILLHVCYRDREEKTEDAGIKHNAGAEAGS